MFATKFSIFVKKFKIETTFVWRVSTNSALLKRLFSYSNVRYTDFDQRTNNNTEIEAAARDMALGRNEARDKEVDR